MDFGETVGLGAIASFTIYLGLPVGRVRWINDRVRVCLAMFSVGILAFIFMDVTEHGEEILKTAVGQFKDHSASFGLHNATGGFGIVGPLGAIRPSWRWLGLAGLIAGRPTLLGTIVGYQVDSELLELLFYALAGGAVLYVIGEVWTGMRRYGHRTLGLYLIATGFLVGVATDLIVAYGGG